MTTHDAAMWRSIAMAALCSVAAAIYVALRVEPAPVVALFLHIAPLLTVIAWVRRDAGRTGVGAVTDLGLFLWIAWPVALPWYAFRTRGPRGWRLLAMLLVLILSTNISAILTALLTWAH
jgi:hypothetical protein